MSEFCVKYLSGCFLFVAVEIIINGAQVDGDHVRQHAMVASERAVFAASIMQNRNRQTIAIAFKMISPSILLIVRSNVVRCGVWVVGVRYETSSQ